MFVDRKPFCSHPRVAELFRQLLLHKAMSPSSKVPHLLPFSPSISWWCSFPSGPLPCRIFLPPKSYLCAQNRRQQIQHHWAAKGLIVIFPRKILNFKGVGALKLRKRIWHCRPQVCLCGQRGSRVVRPGGFGGRENPTIFTICCLAAFPQSETRTLHTNCSDQIKGP